MIRMRESLLRELNQYRQIADQERSKQAESAARKLLGYLESKRVVQDLRNSFGETGGEYAYVSLTLNENMAWAAKNDPEVLRRLQELSNEGLTVQVDQHSIMIMLDPNEDGTSRVEEYY